MFNYAIYTHKEETDMYHCHIHFYLTGCQHGIFEIIRKIPPLEHFTHEFSGSDVPQAALAANADVIFANLQDMDAREAFQALVSSKQEDAKLIILADKYQIAFLADNLHEVSDIWTMPMSDKELRFRFLRWQQSYKKEKDSDRKSTRLNSSHP